jgi:hypothetical protein
MKIAHTSYEFKVLIKIEIHKSSRGDLELCIYCNGSEVETDDDIGHEFDNLEEIQEYLNTFFVMWPIDVSKELKKNEELKNWIENLTNL